MTHCPFFRGLSPQLICFVLPRRRWARDANGAHSGRFVGSSQMRRAACRSKTATCHKPQATSHKHRRDDVVRRGGVAADSVAPTPHHRPRYTLSLDAHTYGMLGHHTTHHFIPYYCVEEYSLESKVLRGLVEHCVYIISTCNSCQPAPLIQTDWDGRKERTCNCKLSPVAVAVCSGSSEHHEPLTNTTFSGHFIF
mgnify:CR=1 FL=1